MTSSFDVYIFAWPHHKKRLQYWCWVTFDFFGFCFPTAGVIERSQSGLSRSKVGWRIRGVGFLWLTNMCVCVCVCVCVCASYIMTIVLKAYCCANKRINLFPNNRKWWHTSCVKPLTHLTLRSSQYLHCLKFYGYCLWTVTSTHSNISQRKLVFHSKLLRGVR